MRRPRPDQIAAVVLLLALANALAFWFHSLGQPLIDLLSFRQTQTALTTLWLQPNMERFLNYETPVLGAPWSVPFEFPLYQLIVAWLARTLSLDLSLCGRLVSLLFGLGCMAAALQLLRQFGFSRLSRLLFAILYLSSSIYLYWNRSFMIESTALFFTLCALVFYSRNLLAPDNLPLARRLWMLLAFTLCLSLGLLVKATTAAPLLLLLSIHLLWRLVRRSPTRTGSRIGLNLSLLAGTGIGALFMRQWTHHADGLKALNPYGLKLTSEALRNWNYGRLEDRFSSELWQGVLIERMMTTIAWLPLLFVLATGIWTLRHNRLKRDFACACCLLSILPLLLFSNLHIVHIYYQAANQIFLLLALAVSGAAILESPRPARWVRLLAIASLLTYLIADADLFQKNYRSFAMNNSDEKLEIGRIIDRSIDRQAAILVLGNDWDSSFAYHTRRRSLTLPLWYPKGPFSQQGVLADPGSRLKPYPLGAVISSRPLMPQTLSRTCPGYRRHPPVGKGDWNVYLCAAAQQPGTAGPDPAQRG